MVIKMFSLSGLKILRPLAGKLSVRISMQLLAAWIAVPFFYYGFVLGATFWIDGFCYSGLAAALRDPNLFREFNSGWGKLSLGHLQPGIPALCWMLDHFPDNIQWPILTILQRTVAFAAVLWCCLEACNYRPTVAVLVLAGFFVWNPFYQSFHNALLTESLNSSLLLFAVAISFLIIRRKSLPNIGAISIAAGCLTIVLITNIRSYYGLACFLMLMVSCLSLLKKKKWILISIFSITFAFAAIAYPTLRWIFIKDWYLPTNDTGYMLMTAWSSIAGGPSFEKVLKTLPKSARAKAKKLGSPGQAMDYNEARLLAECLLEEGATPNQVSLTFRSLTKALNTDNENLFEARVRKALITSGFIELGLIHFGAAPVLHRSWESNKCAAHIRGMYLYHAWYSNAKDYSSFFVDKRNTFVATAEGQYWFRKTHGSYVKNKIPKSMGDPFRVALIPFDVWALTGIGSMLYLIGFRYDLRGIVLIIPLVINFVVMFTVPLGNPRYAHSLLAVYFMAAITAITTGKFQKSYSE